MCIVAQWLLDNMFAAVVSPFAKQQTVPSLCVIVVAFYSLAVHQSTTTGGWARTLVCSPAWENVC